MSKNNREVSAYADTPAHSDRRVKVKRVYRIRCKPCKTALVMIIACYILAIATIFYPFILPFTAWFYIDTLLTILPMFYVEFVEVERHE